MKTIILPPVECIIRQIRGDELDALWMFLPRARDHFDSRMERQAKGEIEYVGAFVGGHAVGLVVLDLEDHDDLRPYRADQQCANVVNLHVINPFRGLGIGKELLLDLEERCRERGIEYLGLDVDPKISQRAFMLYRKLGFRKVSAPRLGSYEIVEDDGTKTTQEESTIGMLKHLVTRE